MPRRQTIVFHKSHNDVLDVPHPPKISYHTALRAWFVHDGRAYNVECCEQEVFGAFVDQATKKWYPKQRALLDDLSYSEAAARWYALNILLDCKASIHLFASEEEARCAASANY